MERNDHVKSILQSYQALLSRIVGMNGSILDLHLHNIALYLDCLDDAQIEIVDFRLLLILKQCPVGWE